MSITSYTKVTAIPIVLQEPTQWDVVALYVTIIALNAPVLLNVGNVNQRTIYTGENAIPSVLERHTQISLTVDAKTATQPAQHAHQAIPAIHAKTYTIIIITRNVEKLAHQEQELIQ